MDDIKDDIIKLSQEREGGGLILFCMLGMMLAYSKEKEKQQ